MGATRRVLAILVLVSLISTTSAHAFGFGFGFGTWLSGRVAQWVDLVQHLLVTSTDSKWTDMALSFGSQDVGTTTTATFNIVNDGNDTAEDVATTVTGAGFSLYSTTTFGNISAARTRVAKVKFVPSGAGAFTGFASYSAPNIARVSVALSGTGVGAAAAPTTPIITATAGDTLVTIAKTSSEAGSPTPSYDLKRGTVSGTRAVVASAISLPYSDTSLTNGTPYYYSLVASNASGTVESLEVTATPASAPTTDDFNRIDETPLAGNWTTSPGFIALNLALNKVAAVGTNDEAAYWSAASFSSNQYSEAILTNLANDCGPAVRLGNSGSTKYGYGLSVNSATTARILKWVGGSASVVGAQFAINSITATQVFRIEISGTTITCYQDGVQKYQTTDSSISTGAPGVFSRSAGGRLDNWAGGSL